MKKQFFKNVLAVLLCLTVYQTSGNAQEYPSYSIVGMASQEIVDKAQKLNEIDPDLYKNKIDLPGEVIYELIDGLDWSLAIADITNSLPHFHRHTLETYTVVTGVLEVTVDNERYILNAGDVFVIPLYAVHSAKSLTNEPARILVSCLPGWTAEDHNLVNEVHL